MIQNFLGPNALNQQNPMAFKLLWPFAILDIVLKGFALWRAVQRKQLYWFIALLLVNSLGILPGIYLYLTSKKKKAKED